MPARFIAVMNQKGGVGKTTTTLNLAHALARMGKRVVALDLDPQAHLTASFGMLGQSRPGMDEVLLNDVPVEEAFIELPDGLRMVASGERLAEVDQLKDGGAKRGSLLQAALSKTVDDADFVLIDCPPSAGLLSMNALFASREVLVPVSGDFLALHGLSRLMSILQQVEAMMGRRFSRWILLTRYNHHRRLAREVREKVTQYFPGEVLSTAIREAVSLAESPSFGQTIFQYQERSHGAEDYHSLARDLIERRTCGTATDDRLAG